MEMTAFEMFKEAAAKIAAEFIRQSPDMSVEEAGEMATRWMIRQMIEDGKTEMILKIAAEAL